MKPLDFWNRYLRAYDALNSVGAYSRQVEDFTRKLEIRPGLRVLDAGSGTGNFSMHLRALGARVTSLDFSPVALAIHREKDPTADVVRASLTQRLPFADRSFERVVCTSVLFAIPPAAARMALREFGRVLVPGGRLLTTVMVPGVSKSQMLARHINGRFKNLPLRVFAAEMRREIPPLLKVLYYNWRMRGLSAQQAYRQYSRGEFASEVREAGFRDLEYSLTYGGRFHLLLAVNPERETDRRERRPARATEYAAIAGA